MIANFCFKCDKELEVVFGGKMSENDPQCSGALMFEARGNYGSTIFDPIGREISLLINICDACVTAGKDRVLFTTVDRPLPVVSYEPWDPEKDYQ